MMTCELWETLEMANGCSWAVVQAGEHQTRYLRLGRGAPVIVLPSPERNSTFWVALNAELGGTHRVMIPDCTSPPVDVVRWFRSFLDGIGLPATALVVSEEFAVAALECALVEPEMVSHIVIVPNPGPDQGALEGYLSSTQPLEQIPVLMVRPGASDREGVAQLKAFLTPGAYDR